MSQNDADRMANSVDADQTAPLGALSLFHRCELEHQSSHLSVIVSFVEIGRKIQFYCQFSTYGNYPKFSDTQV